MAEKRDVVRNFRLTKSENQALERLAEHGGVTCTDVLARYIRQAAKRKKLWPAHP